MNQEPTEPEQALEIMLKESAVAVIERGLPSIMKHFDMNRNEALAYALTLGGCMLLKSVNETLEHDLEVRDAIHKVKNRTVSSDELEKIVAAARNGHLAARILLEDIKRFGRSIDKE